MAPAEHQIHGAPRLALASVTGILMALYLLWVVGQNAAALMALQRCSLAPTVSKACSLASGVGSAVYVSGVLLLPALAALFGGLA